MASPDQVARKYLGSIGKVDNGGILAVASLWTYKQRYHLLHLTSYTLAAGLADDKRNASFQTKPQIALVIIEQAIAAGIRF